MNWLVKEEPSNYNFETLIKDGRTAWTGVKNPLAQKHLKSIHRGDKVFFYHTGNEKAIVGVARALSDAYQDSKDKTGKLSAFDLGPVRRLRKPVTLAAIKADGRFTTFPLVRMSRLSVMPVTDAEWKAIEAMSGGEGD
jgi:predicted RNA-binding protein with PUA-like domain